MKRQVNEVNVRINFSYFCRCSIYLYTSIYEFRFLLLLMYTLAYVWMYLSAFAIIGYCKFIVSGLFIMRITKNPLYLNAPTSETLIHPALCSLLFSLNSLVFKSLWLSLYSYCNVLYSKNGIVWVIRIKKVNYVRIRMKKVNYVNNKNLETEWCE